MDKLEFTNIDAASLPQNAQAAYARLKETWKASKAAKEAFEAAARAAIPAPDGFKVVFGHKFGKLGVAFAPADEPKAGKAKPVMTLAQFNALQDAAGLRR